MFTVLHRDPKGCETYYEADRVCRYTLDGEQSVPPLGVVRAYGVTSSGQPGDTVDFDISGPFGAVFVMNRFGATIARYMHA